MDILDFISGNVWYTVALAAFIFVLAAKCFVPKCMKKRKRKTKKLLNHYEKNVEMNSVSAPYTKPAPTHPSSIPTEKITSHPKEKEFLEEKETEEKEMNEKPVYVDMCIQTDPPTRRNNIVKVKLSTST